MLTSTHSKPTRIQPGDEYGAFGGPVSINTKKSQKSPRKQSKNTSNTLSSDDGQGFGSFGFDVGLSSSGSLRNAFGEEINDYDIEVSWDALSAISEDKRVTIKQFAEWINKYLQLNWDEQRIKRAWAVLDQDKAKYITFREFRSGLKSTNSDVILFFSNLMSRSDVHPMKGDKSDWENVNGGGRIKRMREFSPRYLRMFSRKKDKKNSDFQEFLIKWRKFSIDFLHTEYWKPVEAKGKNYSVVVGNLWQKMCNMMGVITAECAVNNKYNVVIYELFIIMERVCRYQQFIAYLAYKHMLTVFMMNFNLYDINNSNDLGKIAWCQSAMIATIKYANRPSMSFQILSHIADLLLVKLSGVKESEVFNASKEEKGDDGGGGGSSSSNKKDKDLTAMKLPKTWNECCKISFLQCLCIAIDCTEQEKQIKDIKGKDGGISVIKKLCKICIGIFTRSENNVFLGIIECGFRLLSRIDIMDAESHDKVLKLMQTDQRKKYNRNFGKTRIYRFTSKAGGGGKGGNNNNNNNNNNISTSHRSSSPRKGGGGGGGMKGISKVKPGYGAESPQSVSINNNNNNKKGGYTQKYTIGSLGASVAMKKIKSSVSTKSRIIDVASYDKLQSPFEFKITREDILAAFRYADVNQDNAISFTDFTQSLVKVGIFRDDTDAREMWLILNPSNYSKGVNLNKFELRLKEYPKLLHNWLCRIVSCNHLARQPFKTDPDSKTIKKILKDQRKLTWKERIDALHAVARLFARTNDSKKEFQNKFKSFLPRLLDHLRDPHNLVVRASCVCITKIMIYKNGSMTKYAVKIMDGLTANFKKTDIMILESSFGCFANLVRHVPDNKKFATLQHILKLISTKNVSVRCMGWRIAAITFERILGLKKARPNSWWQIAENILKIGKKEKSKPVQREAIRLLFIFQNSSKHYHYVEQYIRFWPTPDDMESIKNSIVSDIQQRMDEYAAEAAAQADAMDVYSLISTEQDPQDDEYKIAIKDTSSSVGGGGPSAGSRGGGMFDFVDDIMNGKEIRDPLANRGLGKRLILHRIDRDTIKQVYELYDIGNPLNIDSTRTLLASLKYLGINIHRGELTLLMSEMKTRVLINNRQQNIQLTQDKYAFFVKHCFATLDVSWKTYLTQKNDLLENMEDEYANIESPKKQFEIKIAQLNNLCIIQELDENDNNDNNDKKDKESNLMSKCELLSQIYALFVTPEVENDDILFEEMMEKLNPIILNELKNNINCSIWIQEICIFICRIAQYHISRFAEYGSKYYDIFFQIIAFGSNIVSHCCSKTCLVIATMVQFLNVPTATEMTQSLISCMNNIDIQNPSYWQYLNIIYKCLLAEILSNVPLIRDNQQHFVKQEVIEKIWNIMKNSIYSCVARRVGRDNNDCLAQNVENIAANILGYMHSAEYLNLYNAEKAELNENGWKLVCEIKEEKTWNNILREDIDANETAPFNNLALEHGWDNLNYYSFDFIDRNTLLEQWYELEQKSSNPIGMAAVTQLIKALNHTQYKAKKTQIKPDDYDQNKNISNLTEIVYEQNKRNNQQNQQNQQQQQNQPQQTTPIEIPPPPKPQQEEQENNKQKQAIHNATGGGADLNSLRAQYLARQRQQNQRR